MDENVKNIEDITKIEKSAEDKVEKLEKKIKLPQEKKKKIKSVNHVLQPLDPLPLLEYDQLHLREELVKFLGEWSYQLVELSTCGESRFTMGPFIPLSNKLLWVSL